MDVSTLKPIIEAMIFVAEEPITEGNILTALSPDGVGKEIIRECLLLIENDWNNDATRGMGINKVAGGYQFRTKPGSSEWLKRLSVPKPLKLSGPSLETLAIIAYRQPIVRSEIESIRGVDSGGVLKTLLERRLLRIVGRRDEPGQPLLYGTTREFLEVFNLNALSELPTLKDVEELMREKRILTETKSEGGEQLSFEPVISQPFIERVSIEETPEGEKDEEALAGLEQSLKDLRRLEKNIFPKPLSEVLDDGNEKGSESATTEVDSADQQALASQR